MTTSDLRSFAPVTANRLRLVSGGGVLLLHVLAVIALLFHVNATRTTAPSRSMLLLRLPAQPPSVAPAKPIAPARDFQPPAATLALPAFSVSPREQRGITLPELSGPAGGPSAPAQAAPGDLFSEEKKAEFKRFFKQQATEDARENAKAGASHACDIFRKPGEPKMPDVQTSPNGIAKTFIPGFSVGIQTSGDGKPLLSACD